MLKNYNWWQRLLITQTNILRAMFTPEELVADQKKKYAAAMDYNLELRILPQLNKTLTDQEKFEWFMSRTEQLDWLNGVADKLSIHHLKEELADSTSVDPASLYKHYITNYYEGETCITLSIDDVTWNKFNDVLTPLKGSHKITACDAVYSSDHIYTAEKVLRTLLALNGNPNLFAGEFHVMSHLTPHREIVHSIHNGIGIETLNQLSCFMSHMFRKLPAEEQAKEAAYTRERVAMRTEKGFQPKIWEGAGVFLVATGTLTIDHPEVLSRRQSSKACNINYRVPPVFPFYGLDGREMKDSPAKIRNKYIYGNFLNVVNSLNPKSIWKALTNECKHFISNKLDDSDSVYGLWAGKPLTIYNMVHSITHITYELAGILLGATTATLAYITAVTGGSIYNYFNEAGYGPETHSKELIKWVEKVTGHSFTDSRAKHKSNEEKEYERQQAHKQHRLEPTPSPLLPQATGTGVVIPQKMCRHLIIEGNALEVANLFCIHLNNNMPYLIQTSLPYHMQHQTTLINELSDYMVTYVQYHAMEAAARSLRKTAPEFEKDLPEYDNISRQYENRTAAFNSAIAAYCKDDPVKMDKIEQIPKDLFKEHFGLFVSRHAKDMSWAKESGLAA